MGWRVSFYKADKDKPIEYIIGEWGDEIYTHVTINGECVANKQGTEFWRVLKRDKEFQKEIKCLHEHPDCDYYSITKEGFKQIILAYRERIIEYQKQALQNEQDPTLREKDSYGSIDTPRSLIESELREWESNFTDKAGNTYYFCIDLYDDNKRVSGSWKYKYAIFDMIYVYKNFDWENYTMVVYGG